MQAAGAVRGANRASSEQLDMLARSEAPLEAMQAARATRAANRASSEQLDMLARKEGWRLETEAAWCDGCKARWAALTGMRGGRGAARAAFPSLRRRRESSAGLTYGQLRWRARSHLHHEWCDRVVGSVGASVGAQPRGLWAGSTARTTRASACSVGSIASEP
jgi:hypothetical protein